MVVGGGGLQAGDDGAVGLVVLLGGSARLVGFTAPPPRVCMHVCVCVCGAVGLVAVPAWSAAPITAGDGAALLPSPSYQAVDLGDDEEEAGDAADGWGR